MFAGKAFRVSAIGIECNSVVCRERRREIPEYVNDGAKLIEFVFQRFDKYAEVLPGWIDGLTGNCGGLRAGAVQQTSRDGAVPGIKYVLDDRMMGKCDHGLFPIHWWAVWSAEDLEYLLFTLNLEQLAVGQNNAASICLKMHPPVQRESGHGDVMIPAPRPDQ
jgi:hypothetical protein